MNGYPQSKTRIFVASSTRSVAVAESLRQVLNSDSIEVVPWKELGVFQLSEYTMESLERAANRTQFAAFVLGPDDVIQSDDGGVYVPRDNVVFELGLFLGRIGRRRSYMLKPDGINIKLPSDLSGVTWAQYYLPGTSMDHVRDAANQIRYAMTTAPMLPAISLLTRTVFPGIVLRHAISTFGRYIQSRWRFVRGPLFRCDAQITVCTRDGKIVQHHRVSSVGKQVQPHEGKILWCTFPFSENDGPFECLLKKRDQTG